MTGDSAHDQMLFDVVKSLHGTGVRARIGRLTVRDRVPIETPNCFGLSIRGAVPHLSPDNVAQSRQDLFGGSYMALEDCECHMNRTG
jgi:queuine tRNA-ribosyltransferase accessory subunit